MNSFSFYSRTGESKTAHGPIFFVRVSVALREETCLACAILTVRIRLEAIITAMTPAARMPTTSHGDIAANTSANEISKSHSVFMVTYYNTPLSCRSRSFRATKSRRSRRGGRRLATKSRRGWRLGISALLLLLPFVANHCEICGREHQRLRRSDNFIRVMKSAIASMPSLDPGTSDQA